MCSNMRVTDKSTTLWRSFWGFLHIYSIMAGSRNNSANKGSIHKKFHQEREIVPIKLMPGGVIAARYKDDEFSVIVDRANQPIPYKNL